MDDFKMPTVPSANGKAESTAEPKEDDTTPVPAPVEEGNPQPAAKSPAAPVAVAVVSCPYEVPAWSTPPPDNLAYKFQVLKSGQIIESVKDLQQKDHWKFGRLPDNDIEMAHPTISRFHAVLQYKPKAHEHFEETISDEHGKGQPAGWYIYDMESTHGTFLNKQRIPARVYIRMRVGHMLRLGASTRSYILQGPAEDEEPESELSVTELREQRQRREAEAIAQAQQKAAEREEREHNEGANWGMGEDADEETDLTHNPYASTNNEELFLDDPKRTLRGYFEREAIPLEYRCEELAAGSFVCRVELPLDDARGKPIMAEAVHKGKKKECVVQCALEACRILDRHGVLRQTHQEPLKRKSKTKESDSDDDDFLDRTGDVERKKLRKSSSASDVALTYDDLMKQEAELLVQLEKVQDDIVSYQEAQKRMKTSKEEQDDDDLDSFMENLNDVGTPLDKTEIRKLHLEHQRIKGEHQKVQRLIQLTKPLDLSFASTKNSSTTSVAGSPASAARKQLPMVGKRNQFSKFKVLKYTNAASAVEKKGLASDEEEVEDEEMPQEEEVLKTTKAKDVSASDTDAKEGDVVKEKIAVETATGQSRHYGPSLLRDKILAEGSPEEKSVVDENSLDETQTQDNEIPKTTKMDNKVTKAAVKDVSVSDTAAKEGDVVKEKVFGETAAGQSKHYGPSLLKGEILAEGAPEEKADLDECSLDDFVESRTENINKKCRQRQRLRYKRQEVDIDELEDHESTEKYAKWVPPENQSGDGYTELNKKYGY